MTSVDSGVETGNDSNDSSGLTFSQFVSVTQAHCRAVSSRNKEIEEKKPVIENYKYGGDSQISTPTSSTGPVVVCASKLLEFHVYSSNGLQTAMEVFNKSESNYHRKIKPLRVHRKHHPYFTWINVQGSPVERKMRIAAATNNTMMMLKLLKDGASPNIHDEQGRTPLHLASCRGYTDMVRILLAHGADPNKRDCIGNTPLHLAAVASKISVVTLLLKAGTDVMSLDQHGYNPLQLAQTKLKMLQTCEGRGEEMLKIKDEVYNIVDMLVAYLQKQKKDAREKVETLSSLCSRLSLSNTSDKVQDDVKDLLANLDALTITS